MRNFLIVIQKTLIYHTCRKKRNYITTFVYASRNIGKIDNNENNIERKVIMMFSEKFDNLFEMVVVQEPDNERQKANIDGILRQMKKLPEYFNAVASTSLQIKAAFFTHHDSERGELIEACDRHRRDCHQEMTIAINYVNRVCDKYQIDRIFPVDHDLDIDLKDDRAIAAQYSWECLKESVLCNTHVIDKGLNVLDNDPDIGVKQMEDNDIRIRPITDKDVFSRMER